MSRRSTATSPVSFVEQSLQGCIKEPTSNDPICQCCAQGRCSGNADMLFPPLKFTYIPGKCLLDSSDILDDGVMKLCETSTNTSDLSQSFTGDESVDGVSALDDVVSSLDKLSHNDNSGSSVMTSDCNSSGSCKPTVSVSSEILARAIKSAKNCNVITVKIDTDTVETSPISVPSRRNKCAETMVTPLKHKDMTVMTERVKTQNSSTSPIVIMRPRNEQLTQIQVKTITCGTK